MDKWKALLRLYKNDHNSKDYLAAPNIRLNAMKSIDKLMTANFKNLVEHPKILKQIDKEDLKSMLAVKKGAKLNSAEESVINGLYKFLPEL
jgi:hypothetical protein